MCVCRGPSFYKTRLDLRLPTVVVCLYEYMFPAYHACLACRGCLACLDWNIRLTHRRHSARLPAFLKLLRIVDGVRLVWFGPVRFDSVRFGSVRFGSVRFGSVRFGSVRFGSVRFGSVRFGSVFSVSRRAVFFRFVSVRMVVIYYGSLCFGLFRLLFCRFVLFRFVSFRFVSFRGVLAALFPCVPVSFFFLLGAEQIWTVPTSGTRSSRTRHRSRAWARRAPQSATSPGKGAPRYAKEPARVYRCKTARRVCAVPPPLSPPPPRPLSTFDGFHLRSDVFCWVLRAGLWPGALQFGN